MIAGMDVKGVAAAVQEDAKTSVVPTVCSIALCERDLRIICLTRIALREGAIIVCRWRCEIDGV